MDVRETEGEGGSDAGRGTLWKPVPSWDGENRGVGQAMVQTPPHTMILYDVHRSVVVLHVYSFMLHCQLKNYICE